MHDTQPTTFTIGSMLTMQKCLGLWYSPSSFSSSVKQEMFVRLRHVRRPSTNNNIDSQLTFQKLIPVFLVLISNSFNNASENRLRQSCALPLKSERGTSMHKGLRGFDLSKDEVDARGIPLGRD